MSRRAWLEQGTALFRGTVDRLSDTDFDRPTSLPGWTRRHVIAHVHYNAEALQRLLHWARTGERTPMYSDGQQRAAEIESGASLPTAELRRLVHASAQNLAADLDALPETAWNNQVVTAQGRTVPASELVWMRTREVAVHAIDLDAGVEFADLPHELNAALVADIVRKRTGGPEAAALAAWLSGRASQAPALGPWL